MRERTERVESTGTYATYELHSAILLGTVFFRTALPFSVGYDMERGWMPLHDVVGINCKNGATTENQGSGVKYMGYGVYLDDCGCVI